jgi:hypothetical protein
MSKVFIGFVLLLCDANILTVTRGLAWHTDDATLRQKFEEFGTVEEAVRYKCTFVAAITSNNDAHFRLS